MKSTYISTWMQRLAALMFVLVGSISTSLADTKLYLEDFSFSSAGETKKVAVCLDTDESTIYSVKMTLALPADMQFVADGNKIKTELVGSRTGALTMESSFSNGKIMFSDLLRSSAIDAGNGPIFYVYVKDNGFFASANASENITISGVELKRQDKSKVDGVVATGATVSKNGSVDPVTGINVAFAASEVTMAPGETKTIAVNMDNTGKTVQGFQATLDLPTGWTAEVTCPRGAVTYNATTGRITNIEGISGVSGAVLNIALTAPTTFAGSAQIKLSGVKATVNFATVNLSDITSTINATETVAEKPTVAFAAEEIVVYPGKTGKFEVNMANNGITVDGFQADLVLPAGWTAAVTGKRGTYTYNANNGRIMNYTGVTGEEGALFEVDLSAPANFEGEAVVKLANVKATINYVGVKLDEISMKVLDKDAAKETALADLKAEITAATTLLGEADKTVEPGLSLNDAIAAAQTAAQTAEADMMVAQADVLAAATETLKTAEETYTAAVEAAAALAAAKQTLTDEIATATTLLGEADKTAEPGLSLNNAIADAQAILDNAESTTEQITAAVETLKTAEETYTAAVEAAAKAAAKMALTDEVVAATTLLGDADKTVEPGKALSDAITAAKAVLASEATTEELTAAVETLKAAEDVFDAAVNAAVEAAAKEAAEAKVADLKTAAEALAVSAEAKAYEAENVQTAVAAAEEAITGANTAIAAVEAKIAEGKLSTDNKEALATAIADAEQAIADAQTAIATAEQTYIDQLAIDDAAALAVAKTALQDAVTAAKAANVEGMTAESVQALNDAIAAAEAALAAETATVESLNAAKTALDEAVAGLVVAPLFADGKYYIYNNDVQKYLAAGSSWGTHAVVNATGLDYILTLADGKYTMDSQVSNGGNNHFLNGEWNDGGAMGWTFEAVEGKEGVYTISDGTQFLTAQENGEVLLKEDATVEAAQWTLKTVEARVAELAAATAEAPVDASFLITDANFGRNDLRKSAWTTEASNLNMSGGNNTNNCAESYHSVFSLSQTLTNLPKGVYALTAQGFYRQDGQDNDNLPVFFANNEAITFPAKTGSENNMSQASESFTAGNYTIAPIYVQVAEDGQLTVGAKLEENTALWCIWDNFQLTYYGADADIEQLKNAAIIAELAALREQLAEKKDQVEVEVVKTEAENALTATADVTGTDAINAAVETLKAALDRVEASLDAKAKLANMKELVDATNVYTAEAKNEYYDQWVVKYNDGTITKAEANALQDPFIVTGWHANITVDNFLLSAWDTNPDFQDAPYYINSWSVEGESDGSNFKVPFFEYWTNDDSSLGEKTLTATMNGLEAGEYNVTAWVRVRMKNGAEAPATGVKLQANDGEAVDVCDGEAFGPMYVKEVAATGTVAEDGVLKIKFNVAADNNVSWLSFKNVKFEKHITVDPIIEAAKTALQDAITAAKAANIEGKSAESVQALTDAIAAAEAALAAEDATVESLNTAKTALDEAVAGLVVAPLFADGKYYIYNNDVQKYLAAGSSWGTHAVVNATGLDYILTLADGKYTMDSQVSNGGNNHFLNGEWNDGGAMGWTFEAVEGKEGVYTISDGTQFLTAQENGEVLLKEDATVEAAQWTLKTVEARVAELAAATAEAPVDASFLITDANFGRNDLRKSAWTTEASNLNMSGGNNTNNCAESYHSVFSLSQTLTNLPKGVYALTAQGFYRQDGQDNDNLPVFFANNEAITFPAKTGSENNMSQASESFTAGNYTIAPIYVQVAEDGQLTVGAKLEENTALWCIWDNFQLTYYGADADIEQLKNAAIIAELAALREQLAEKKDQVEVEVVKTEAENALTATADVTGTDAINAAVETLKAALDRVEASLDAKAKLANMKELVDATNVYTAEAKNEYYDQWVVKYNDGTITKAEANALQDPFIVTGWHANITVDNFLLSAWDTNPDFQDAPYYINSWSVEGESDGSNFKVPFFEYWTNDDSSLGEKTLTATMNGLEAGEYNVTAWVRVRMKNGAEAPATGVKLQANDGEAVDVCDGEAFGPMYVKEVAATGTVAEDGVLKIKFNVAADNNVSWLSFKNVKFEKHITVDPIIEAAKTALQDAITAAKAIETEGKNGGDVLAAAITTAETALNAADATAESLTAAKETLLQAKSVFNRANLEEGLVEIAQNQGKDLDTFTRAELVEGEGFNTYTVNGDLNIAFKMVNLDVKNCDYVTIKFAEPVAAGWHLAFWSNQDLVDVPAGATEFKYVFADDPKCGVSADGVLPQICMMTFFGGFQAPLVAKVEGIYKHQIPVVDAINSIAADRQNGIIFNMNGQKVDKAQKGMYIINGKKVVIK